MFLVLKGQVYMLGYLLVSKSHLFLNFSRRWPSSHFQVFLPFA